MRAIFSLLTAISILGIYLEEYLAKKYNFIIEGIFEMKIKIGPYTEWFGPNQLADALCFWMKKTPLAAREQWLHKEKSYWVDKLGEWLTYGNVKAESIGDEIDSQENGQPAPTTLLCKFLIWVHSKKKRKIKVHIDYWDTWSMDDTLAHIVLPMLKQLKETKNGAPPIDSEDCPKHLRRIRRADYSKNDDVDPKFFERWDWVLNEMIFAFESKIDDTWEDQFYTSQEGDDTHNCDHEGMKVYQARISNGFRLFGKYYEALWD